MLAMPLPVLSFPLSYVMLLIPSLLPLSMCFSSLLSFNASWFDDMKAATSYSGADRASFNMSGEKVKGVVQDAAPSKLRSRKSSPSIEELKSALEVASRVVVVPISLLFPTTCGADAAKCVGAGTIPRAGDFRARSEALLASVDRLPDRCERP